MPFQVAGVIDSCHSAIDGVGDVDQLSDRDPSRFEHAGRDGNAVVVMCAPKWS